MDKKACMLPEVEEQFELKGYEPGVMGLKDGRQVDFRTLPLVDVDKIYRQGTAAPFLVKKSQKQTTKKKIEPDKQSEPESN